MSLCVSLHCKCFPLVEVQSPLTLSHIRISSVVARDGLRRYRGHHVSSGGRLVWIWAETQKDVSQSEQAAILPLKLRAHKLILTFFHGVSSVCKHTSGMRLHRGRARPKTSRCTSPLQSHTCHKTRFTMHASVQPPTSH